MGKSLGFEGFFIKEHCRDDLILVAKKLQDSSIRFWIIAEKLALWQKQLDDTYKFCSAR